MDKTKVYLGVFLVLVIGVFSFTFFNQGVPSPLLMAKGGGGGGTGDAVLPTTVITSPADQSVVARGQATTITAEASDNVAVARVDFYASNKRKCTVSAAPYTCAWEVPAGKGKTYSLQARAYDTSGNVGNSDIVTVTSE